MDPAGNSFTKSARECFDFLMHDFGFTFTEQPQTLGESVRYDSPIMYVAVSLYKGEIDVIFWVKIDTPIIRPASPRMFEFQSIIRELDKDAFRHAPTFPTWERTPGEDFVLLRYYSSLVKKYCGSILRGDFSVLEALCKKRGG
jgi:hypothetical protein